MMQECALSTSLHTDVVDDALDQWRKDWKRVSMQKVVTLNTCCDAACLTFKLPSQPALFGATNIFLTIYLQSDEQDLHFTTVR